MPSEIALFWVVLAGLLAFDNLVLVPAGGDFLRVSGTSDGARSFRYDARIRLQVRARDLVILNPLNPFDRIAVTAAAAGHLAPAMLRSARALHRQLMPPDTRLAWLGTLYLVQLAVLGFFSFRMYFGLVLIALGVVHVLVWLAALAILVACRRALQLGRGPLALLALEALLVPGYLVNLSKRVWLRQVPLELPGIAMGLRELAHMDRHRVAHQGSTAEGDHTARDLYALRLLERVEEVTYRLEVVTDPGRRQSTPGSGPSRTPKRQLTAWLMDARTCLKASVPPAGS